MQVDTVLFLGGSSESKRFPKDRISFNSKLHRGMLRIENVKICVNSSIHRD